MEPELTGDWREKHLRYFCAPFELTIRPDEACMFSPEEVEFLRRWGAWMLALASKHLRAETVEQQNFVAAAIGRRPPETWAEQLWAQCVQHQHWANLLPEEEAEMQASMEEYEKEIAEEAAADEAAEKWMEQQEAEGWPDCDEEKPDADEGSPFTIDDLIDDDERMDDEEELSAMDYENEDEDYDAESENLAETDDLTDGESSSDEDDDDPY